MKKLMTLLVVVMCSLFALSFTGVNVRAAGGTVTYTVISTSNVDVTGTAPEGATHTYVSTYSSKCQLTGGNSMTLTLSGYDGYKITSIVLSMKSNASKGAGNLSVEAGETTICTIATAKFNAASWNGAWSTSYVDITPTMVVDDYFIQEEENVVITIAATDNSLYCQSFTLTYTDSDEAATQLTTPTDASLTGNNLSWSEVENASGYVVGLFANEADESPVATYEEATTSHTINHNVLGSYYVKVKAKGDNVSYLDSLWTDSLGVYNNLFDLFESQTTKASLNLYYSYTNNVLGEIVSKTEELVFSEMGFSSNEKVYSIAMDNEVTLSVVQVGNSAPIYHSDGEWRVYKSHILTIASEHNIQDVVFSISEGSLATATITGGTFDNERNAIIANESTKEITITLGEKNFFQSISVTVQKEVERIYTVSKADLRFGTVIDSDLYEALNAQEATFGVTVTKGGKDFDIECTPAEVENGWQFAAVLTNIPETDFGVVVSAKCYVEVDGVKYYMNATQYSVETIASVYITKANVTGEQLAALKSIIG